MVAGFILAATSLAQAAEPWADPKLPVHDGLQLWIEAGRQRKAADAREAPAFTQGAKREIVFDGSGHRHDLRQPDEAAQPQYHRVFQSSDLGYLRFDGQNDALLAEKLDARLDAFTLFYVAAPRGNPGGSRAFFSLRAAGDNSASPQVPICLPIDLGADASPQLSALFVSGPGFETPVNIMRRVLFPFGTLHNFEITCDGGKKTFRVRVDGQITGERPCEMPALEMAGLVLGARYTTATPEPNRTAGFSQADVSEMLVYNRALSEDEAAQVRGYLTEKYQGLTAMLARDIVPGAEELVSVMNPPPVQIFVPGFTVRELPIELSNINNLRSRPDGTLVALAYDGNIWLIRDTDGDGLEDRAELFWDGSSTIRGPIGMDLTPPGYPAGNGVFVASKGKCSLVVDTNGDDKGDSEIVIAEGWTALPHGVDAVGVACDPRDGSVYFGLGTSNYSNAYIVDAEGKAGYSLQGERGTIMRVAPDFKSREIFATGVRFPVGLAFNRQGDLFATDQEGATWLPNGNPFDELLHIQRGRHYGFPPRHPRHLPDVIDEPSLYDYAPQHQSTCGLCFNYPVAASGRTFGPKEWAGDLFVAGYSRGKLYRTKLSQSKTGYVAATELLGCTTMLPAEVCLTADGGLVVACHSGGPDWGSGPTGKGKLYKVTYSEPESPRPLFAWPATPGEIHVAFDRPVNPEDLRDAVRQMKVTAGRHVRAGDRFESLWPGYAAVHAQKGAPRFDVPMRSAQLLPDRRTLILATDAYEAAVHYAVTLPRRSLPATPRELPQSPEADLDFDLSGCEASWKPADGGTGWNGWLPHVDLQVARELTAGSQRHDALWTAMASPGVLTLNMQINLTDMLRPAVQPGSRIDYEWPTEQVTLTFEATGRLAARVVDGTPVEQRESPDRSTATLVLNPVRERTFQVELKFEKAAGAPFSALAWHTHEDGRARAMPAHRLLVPWARVTSDKPLSTVRAKELDGGNWARGRQEFFGQQAGCSKCHSIHGQGGQQAPDLSNLGHRDYASVLRDITEPNFAINPDFLSYVLTLKNGTTLAGTVRTSGDTLQVGDTHGTLTSVARGDVEEMVAASTSTMPEGLPKQLSPERLRDLLTYLLTPTPQMPRDYSGQRPKPRQRAAVDALLAGASIPAEPARPIRIVLVAGPKDHRPGEHDYPAWQKVWGELLSLADGVEVAAADAWPAPEEFEKADVLMFYQHGVWDEKRAAQIDPFLARGGGLVYIHFAVDGGNASDDFSRRIGLAWKSGPGFSKFRHGTLDLVFNRDRRHPIARNFESFSIVDESYWNLAGSLPSENVLATGIEQGEPQPLFWTVQHPQGRVFVSIPGHFSWTFDDPLFRALLLRGIAWAAHEPVDRFNDLVWPGADVVE